MREILFRAKEINANKWAEGYLVKISEDDYRIATEDDVNSAYTKQWDYDGYMTKINPETICQYTGLTDKNGNKIWENDIVEILREDENFKIEWQEDTAQFVMVGNSFVVTFDNYWSYETEVIGTIFDNPGVLERMG